MAGQAAYPNRAASARTGSALRLGAWNLLDGCAGVDAGQRIAVLAEDPRLGWYDAEAPAAVAAMASEIGADPQVIRVGGPAEMLPPQAEAALADADVVIWFARIGDQTRFAPRRDGRVEVVSYARTAAALGSDFGLRPHGEMAALKEQVHAAVARAGRIFVTCPLGTALDGAPEPGDPEDVTIRRFPLSVPAPVPAATFSGRVAIARPLCPTGSRCYQPASVALSGVVFAQIEHGRVVRYDGDPADCAAVEAHYAQVSGAFGIDAKAVHSWHAGLHSGCLSADCAGDDPDWWANTVFGSPRWLHVHTCGNYAPGEICWMVKDPTISLDGVPMWDEGRLTLDVSTV